MKLKAFQHPYGHWYYQRVSFNKLIEQITTDLSIFEMPQSRLQFRTVVDAHLTAGAFP